MILILGMTRGGNTWLGKIFDAHPDVLYRHEPDSILKAREIPAFCQDQDAGLYLAPARDYFDAVLRVRTSKALGTFPVMPKSYLSPLRHQLKRALVVGAKGLEKIGFFSRFFRDAALPEMTGGRPVHHVVKSIAALGQMNLFSRLYPDAKVILLLRHPAGQVASALKAIASDKIDGQPPATEDWGIYRDLAATAQGRRHGLTLEVFQALDPVERLAWRWAISYDKALEDLQGHPNVQIVLYEELCADPVSVGRRLFGFAGLDWRPEVERFVRKSSTAANARTYDRVIRDSIKTAASWRTSLAPDTIKLILQVMQKSRAGQYYLTGAQPARRAG
ncbi:MAG TPA: sulfotransferase [Rhizomicrobium sp.]|nr:sulfotransferase [Rhizomicrobium sp.]